MDDNLNSNGCFGSAQQPILAAVGVLHQQHLAAVGVLHQQHFKFCGFQHQWLQTLFSYTYS